MVFYIHIWSRCSELQMWQSMHKSVNNIFVSWFGRLRLSVCVPLSFLLLNDILTTSLHYPYKCTLWSQKYLFFFHLNYISVFFLPFKYYFHCLRNNLSFVQKKKMLLMQWIDSLKWRFFGAQQSIWLSSPENLQIHLIWKSKLYTFQLVFSLQTPFINISVQRFFL